ncbi:hypothetical protein ACIRPT_06535 [Streptomyces sp. NPDC101227]|uniref:hypothetical protein n=1 Tax=Streptomyces sp. NPDC101227 TaxID=3366136 RepID=UPI003800AF35
MTKHRKSSHPKMGEGPSMHEGTEQHGWSSDVDQTEQQTNESAHRSFHPERYAQKEKDKRGTESAGKEKVPPPSEVKSETRRGERRAAETDEKGMRDMGPKGRSRRPSGGRDAEAHTDVDPQNP